MHKLVVYRENGKYDDYTNIVGSVGWSSSEDTLGVQLDFAAANNKSAIYLPPATSLNVGSMIGLLNGNKEIFRGIAVTEESNGIMTKNYTAFDFAFYLNKSKGIYQFNGISAFFALNTLFEDFGVPIGNIAMIPTIIDYIYYDKTISDIIKDILNKAYEETGIKYRMEMRGGKIYIEKQEDLIISANFQLASNLGYRNILDAISNPNVRRSIEEMKNSIQIVVSNRESGLLVAEAKDDDSIKRYGLLQDVQSIEEKDIAQAKNIAENLLKDFNRIVEDVSFECPGNDDVRAGRLINIKEPVTGINGTYRIKSCSHSLDNGIHKMSLNLGVV